MAFLWATMIENFQFRWFVKILAVLLCVAALFKLHLLLTNPFADLKTGINNTLLVGVIAWELSVGIFVLQTRNKYMNWFFLTLTFTIFVGVSGFHWFSGSASCGCFGTISVPPWFSFIASLSILSILWFTFFNWMPIVEFRIRDQLNSITRQTVGAIGAVCVFCAAVLVFKSFLQNSPEKWLGAVVEHDTSNLVVGKSNEVSVTLVNRSSEHASIVGARSSCACVLAKETAGEIPAKTTAECKFVISPTRSGKFRQRVIVYVDHPFQSQISFEFTGDTKTPNYEGRN